MKTALLFLLLFGPYDRTQSAEPALALPDLNKLRADYKLAQGALADATAKADKAKADYLAGAKAVKDAVDEDGLNSDPAPMDSLAKSLSQAWAATPAEERQLVLALAAVWADEAKHLADEQTNQSVLQTLIAGRKFKNIGDGQLREIRNVIDTPLIGIFGTKPIALTDDLRKQAKAHMEKVVKALQKLGAK